MPENGAKSESLLGGHLGGYELGSVGGRLDGWLFLGKPLQGHLIDEVQDAGNGSSGSPVVVKVGIDVGGKGDGFAKRLGGISWEFLVYLTVHGVGPVVVHRGKVGKIRLPSADSDASMGTRGSPRNVVAF